MRPLDQPVTLLAWLIEPPLEGAMQQFQQVSQENLGPFYRYVYRKVGNREADEDLTSQVFLKALQGLDLQCDPHRSRTWLFHVARTTLADYWRAYFRGTASSRTFCSSVWSWGDDRFSCLTPW